ncbi:Maestro heat-like repeat family member 5 isoform X2 [Aix galericulata]|nr:Maestro heat-like repeat family member 5 isoform X2 [Aix galericulata]
MALPLLTKSKWCHSVQRGKLLVLLPDLMNTLQYDNTHITMKALPIFRNVIHHLEKKEASRIALALAGRLLPLFNDVSSEVRECSILLFKDLMEAVLWWKKGEMKKTVHRAIIPLLFRMSDETESVAKVQISDLAIDVGTGSLQKPYLLVQHS